MRNRVAAPLAAPMSFISTLFWAMSIVFCIRKPSPAPSTSMNRPVVRRVESTVSWASSSMPAVMKTPPTMGKTR